MCWKSTPNQTSAPPFFVCSAYTVILAGTARLVPDQPLPANALRLSASDWRDEVRNRPLAIRGANTLFDPFVTTSASTAASFPGGTTSRASVAATRLGLSATSIPGPSGPVAVREYGA